MFTVAADFLLPVGHSPFLDEYCEVRPKFEEAQSDMFRA